MHRGEIWNVTLDPTVGSEIKKKRPCVIINNDLVGRLPNKVIIPITEWDDKFESADWMVKIEPDQSNGLNKTSAADAFQIRSVSEIRLVSKIGILKKKKLDEIVEAVAMVINEI